MGIPFVCTGCKKKFKVKEDLAGQRIKCPGCGTGITIPSTAATGAAVARQDRHSRRKSRGRAVSRNFNNTVVYISAGGFVVSVIALIAVILTNNRSPAPEVSPPDAVQRERTPSPRAEGANREVTVKRIQNDLRQVGIALHSWYDDHDRGPSGPAELRKYYERNTKLDAMLESNQLTIIWGMSKAAFIADSDQVVGYETEADRNGIRIVLRGFGGTEEMNEAEFKAALAKPVK